MSEDSIEGKYPHWRDALFGQDTAANLWCAIEYLFWHGAHALLAVFGLIFIGLAKVWDAIRPSTDTTRSVQRAMHDDRVQKVGDLGFIALFGAMVLFCVGLIVWFAFTYFVQFVIGVAGAIVTILGLLLLVIVWEEFLGPALASLAQTADESTREQRRSAKGAVANAASKAKETPGVRRVYGHCPVSMDVEPKWFENLFGE